MKEVALNSQDLFVMNLVHYFVTEKNYNPIILHGCDDEIWLENLESDYKIIRIICHYIHNNEQLSFDKYRCNRIIKQLKRKTLSFKLETLSIYTDLGDSVSLDDMNSIYIKNEDEIKKNELVSIFPDIVDKTTYKEEGIDLFVKISEDMNKNNVMKTKKFNSLFSSKKPSITYTFIALCVLVFVMMCIFSGDPYSVISGEDSVGLIKMLLMFGANVRELTIGRMQLHRLVLSCFVHIGIMHLFVNMWSLNIVGSAVESFYGKLKFLLIYLISGITGGMMSLMFYDNTVSAGASGAIFGLMGALLYFGYYYRIYMSNALIKQIMPVIIFNLLASLFIPGIDFFAHIGGLVGGILISMAVGVPDKNKTSDRINGIIMLFMYIMFLCYMLFMR